MLHRSKRTATDSVSANRKGVLVLGFRGAEWALWLYASGGGEDALPVAPVTIGVTRILTGGWYHKR